MKKGFIVMQTDFGTQWGIVATMHGVCKQVSEELEICDATHNLPQYDTMAAAYSLQYMLPYWPKGTVFVSVVDPGVGTQRKASVAKTKNGYYIVTPDNGTLTYVKEMYGIEQIREIDETRNRYPGSKGVETFHGRDIFAYCGARLAAGVITYEEVGEEYPVDEIIMNPIYKAVVEEGKITGNITGGGESFGNVETTIRNDELDEAGFKIGDDLHIVIIEDETQKCIFDEKVAYEKSFGYVPIGKAVLFKDLASFVSVGLNQKSFADTYGILAEKVYTITIKK